MPMSIAVLETLEAAEFTPAQARALTRVFESEATARFEGLVHKSDLLQFQQLIKADMLEWRESMLENLAGLRQAMPENNARLEVKIESTKADNMRWTFLAMAGQVAVLTGIMYFLLQYGR